MRRGLSHAAVALFALAACKGADGAQPTGPAASADHGRVVTVYASPT